LLGGTRKASLFTADHCAAAVLNVDDPAGRRVAARATCVTTTISAAGAPDADWRVTHTELDAIARAVQLAGSGDGVLVAGRGHEIVQTVRAGTVALDDRLELRRALTAALA
jgi:UDP-N-acetylmuramoyl-L-alanyl-D-glutamate--2,6-diaminopimelate ligase